ncbi:MAG: hypothetical protein GXW89_02695 [Phycisphaerae bacterium]|nr:hypothetical protein [Phycisphaerae bacterium]
MPSKGPDPERVDAPTPPADPPDGPGAFRDLCSNCDHAEEHARRGRPRRPVFFCEEFEVSGAVRIPEPVRVRPAPAEQAQDAGRRLGLCVNCDNADTCRLPRPEGGVWHCEEYR